MVIINILSIAWIFNPCVAFDLCVDLLDRKWISLLHFIINKLIYTATIDKRNRKQKP